MLLHTITITITITITSIIVSLPPPGVAVIIVIIIIVIAVLASGQIGVLSETNVAALNSLAKLAEVLSYKNVVRLATTTSLLRQKE